MTKRFLVVTLIGVILLGSFLAACGDDDKDDDSQDLQGSESELCSDLAGLNTSLGQVRSLNSSSSADEAKQALKNVQSSLADVKDSAKEVSQATVDDLNDRVDDLRDTVDGLKDGDSLSTAVANLQADLTEVQRSHTNLSSQLGCP